MKIKINYIIIFSVLLVLTTGAFFNDYAKQLGTILADASFNPGHPLDQIEGSENLATKDYVNDAIAGISGSNWTISGSNIYRSSGNVGIGVTNPSVKLHVNGNIIANDPTDSNHVATKEYVDNKVDEFDSSGFLGINFHTVADCVNSGGVSWTTPEGIKICRITSPNINDQEYLGFPCSFYYSTATTVSCPAGWQQYRNWSTTHGEIYRPFTCNNECRNTGSHEWADKVVEVINYDPCRGCTGSCPRSVSAKIVEIGCY